MIPELASKYYLWQVGSVIFFWCYTSNPRLVKHWCTRNTGKWYAANCTYAMTYFWIKTEMIMITQPPCSMRLWMWTTKLQFWELVCIAIHFQIFVCNISIILKMILYFYPFYFTVFFLYFTWSMNPWLQCFLDSFVWNYLSRLASLFCVQEWIRICESNVFYHGIWTLYINWYIQRLYIPLRP